MGSFIGVTTLLCCFTVWLIILQLLSSWKCRKMSKANKPKLPNTEITLIKNMLRINLKINVLWQGTRDYDLTIIVNLHLTWGPCFGYCSLVWNILPCYPGLFWSLSSCITVEKKKLNTFQRTIKVYSMSSKLSVGGLFLPTNCSVIVIIGRD